MEFFKKIGSKVELGCFGLIFIGVFLPFITSPSNSHSLLSGNTTIFYSTTFIGIMIMFFALLGGALVGVETFARDIYDRINNKHIDRFVNYGPLVIGENIFVVTLVLGLIGTSNAVLHMGVGALMIIISSLILTFMAYERKIVFKDKFVSSKDNVKEEVSDKPVMQPISQEMKVTVSSSETPVVNTNVSTPVLTQVGEKREEKPLTPVETPKIEQPVINVQPPKVEQPVIQVAQPEPPKVETPVAPAVSEAPVISINNNQNNN